MSDNSHFRKTPKNSVEHCSPEEDHYIDESGLLVFTASYHLKRGYCCKNGCRHCPYQSTAEENLSKKASSAES